MIILPNDGLSESAIKYLQEEGFTVLDNKVAQEQLIDFINNEGVEVLLVRSATKVREDLIDACPNLRIIGRAGVGMDNIDVEYARKNGKQVINTPGASSKSVGELVIAHMFTLARSLHDANRKMPLEGEAHFKDLKKAYASATELAGKTLGVIGFGRIGQETVKLGLALGMKVVVSDFNKEPKLVTLEFFDEQTIDFHITPIEMDELLSVSDFVSIHVPAQDGYVIGKEQFEKMKASSFIINAARGGVIDEVALVEALNTDKIAGAALDVFENEPTPELPLLMHPKISLTPHCGGSTLEAQDRIGLELAEQIIDSYNGI